MNLDAPIGLIEAALDAALDLLGERLRAIVREVAKGGQIPRADAMAMARARSALDELQGSTLGRALGDALARKRTALEAVMEDVEGEDMGDGPVSFTKVARAAIDALLSVTDDQIRKLAGDATEESARYLMQTVISGGPEADLIDKIASTMQKRKDQARTMAETMVAGFERQLTVQHAQDNGIEVFAYLGPDDGVTREWCSHWAGRSGTVEEFEETGSDWGRESQPLPVLAYGGGYNCRHRFVPLVTKGQRDRYPRGPE